VGASLLDWPIMKEKTIWSVTVLQAAAQMDAGAIWASYNFELSGSSIAKSSVYRRQVTKAAVHGVLEGRLQLSC
jgi:putative two-component system protein, hydrogenase maturation factor HypX/HoxX